MTANPTADEARLLSADALIELHKDAVNAILAWKMGEGTQDDAARVEATLRQAIIDRLGREIETNARAAWQKFSDMIELDDDDPQHRLRDGFYAGYEFNLRSVMKRSDHWQSRAEAAEARIAVLCEEIDMKESVLSVYKSQIEAGAKRIEAAEKALEDIARLTAPEGGLPILAVHDIARRAARALSAGGGQ
jgi:hypothetical protein